MKQRTDDSPALPMWLLGLAGASMLAALYMIFMWVSTEATMGIIQRIFYFHTAAAFVSFWAVFIGGVASFWYLKTRDARFDDLALAANESIVVFEAVNIVMGSMWGKRVWGIWWTWDARLTSSFLLILIYIAYVVVRRAVAAEERPVICAVICLFGMLDVPLVYMSNRLFRTQHPAPVVGGSPGSGLDRDMGLTWIVTIVAMFLVWWCIIRVRRRVAQNERVAETLSRSVHEKNYV